MIVRMCLMCFEGIAQDMVKQSHEMHIISNLQSMLLLQEMEQCLIDKIVNDEKLYSSNRMKNLKDFLDEGKRYLNLANRLDEYSQRNPTIFTIMSQALDIYSKLKYQFRNANYKYHNITLHENATNDMYEMYDDSSDDSDHEYFNIEEDAIDDEDDEDEDDDEVHSWVLFHVGELNFNGDLNESLLDYINHENYIYRISQKFYRRIMLTKIESLIARIQNVYVAFIRTRLSFSRILTDYCERLRLFLSNESLKSNRLEKSQMQNIYCKYNFLKQVIERFTEYSLPYYTSYS